MPARSVGTPNDVLQASPASTPYAVVLSLCAFAATVSPACIVPITVPGGKPTTARAGDTPRSPVTMVGPVLLTFGVAPSTAKLCALPNGGATAASAEP